MTTPCTLPLDQPLHGHVFCGYKDLGRVLLIRTNRFWLLGWLTFSFSIAKTIVFVGLVDQLFQPAQNLVEIVENNG